MAQIGKLQTWEIPPDKLKNWRRLNPYVPKEKATDCAINSLYFLGVIDNPDFANALSEFANTGQRGMYDEEVLQLIYNKFNENNDSKINNYTIGFKTDAEIRSELKNDTYTIAEYHRHNGEVRHTVILTKQNDIIFVLDPQQETTYCELTDYNDWVNSEKFARDENGAPLISYILKNKVARKREETSVRLRELRSPSSPSAKRRKTIRRKITHPKTKRTRTQLQRLNLARIRFLRLTKFGEK